MSLAGVFGSCSVVQLSSVLSADLDLISLVNIKRKGVVNVVKL